MKKILVLKENKIALVLLVLLVFMVCIGVSYAYWYLTVTQSETNKLATDCFEIEFVEESDSIQLEKTYPLLDSEGKKLTPYTFTITNKCNAYASYQINLEVLNSSTLSRYDAIKVMLDEDTPVLLTNHDVVQTTLENAKTSYKLTTGYLDHNESITHNFRLWIDEGITMEDTDVMNKALISKVTVSASYIDHFPSDYELCVEKYGEDSIQCNIIAQAEETSGSCPEVTEEGNVLVTSAESTNGYVCSAPDDYGTSYYYRGNVENNWVKFADSYWRIIRINGDGSIRMIYAGDANVIDGLSNKADVLKNGYNDGSTDYTQIGTSAFNSSNGDNAYVGYMYGTTGASSYEETHTNTNNSTIKQAVDSWYKTNIEDKGLSRYVSDTLFCNDRSLSKNSLGGGFGTEVSSYRWYDNPPTQYPRLNCENQNDRFTVNDEVTGNGDLTYPGGLVTIDEAYLAGGYDASNSKYYLYTGNYYWTMSPFSFFSSNAFVRLVYSSGDAVSSNYVNDSSGVRPVLNLKSGSLKSGLGTANDPYQV